MTERFYSPVIKYTTSALKTLPGALLYFYESGTSTPKTTWADPDRSTPNTNPVVALADGTFPPIFIDGVYRVELKSSSGITQTGWPIDDVGVPSSGFPFQDWSSSYVYSTGDIVIYNGDIYQSLTNNNQGNIPSSSPSSWVEKLLIDAPTAESYLNGNIDGTYTWRTIAQTKSDLSLPTNTVAELLDRVQTVATFADLATTASQVGQVFYLKEYYSGSGVGGGGLLAYAGADTPDNGLIFATATPGILLKRINYEILDLYHFGGAFEGDCMAAMDAALASEVEIIKVPDNVTLGSHTFDASRKIIIGGNNVSFTGASAGIRPRDIDYFELCKFSDFVMSITESDAHQFFAPASGANQGFVSIHDNTGAGGIGGAIASYENGRTIGQCYIYNNTFSDQIGEVGGTGYGIQYANENETGEAWIYNNKVIRAGRHSYYIARNKSNGRVNLLFNKAIDHRENSTITRGNYRPAFEISRSQNVYGFGNEVNGFYDGAFDVQQETVAENPVSQISSHNIKVYASSAHNPKNTLAAFRLGGQTPENDGLRSVHFIGIDFKSTTVNGTAIECNYGHDLLLRDVSIRYYSITSGVIRPIVISSNAAANSSNQVIENVNVNASGCSGSTLQIYRLVSGAVTAQISIKIRNLSVVSDASTTENFSMSAAASNLLIEASGMSDSGAVFGTGVYFKRLVNPSEQGISRISSASITTPVGVLVPQYFGEEIYLSDAAAKSFWKANGLTSSDWVKIGP